MAGYSNDDPLNTPAFQALCDYLVRRRSKPVGGPGDFEEYEKELHRLFAVCEAETVSQDLARHDVEEKYITVDGERYRKALRASMTYTSPAGPIS